MLMDKGIPPYGDEFFCIDVNLDRLGERLQKELKKQQAKDEKGELCLINAGALFPSFSSPSRYIAVLRLNFYLDDSGSSMEGPVFVMAGWLAREKKWNQFERQWQRALDEADIDVFHATDFFSQRGKCNAKGGRYEDWSKEKLDKFTKRFTAIAEKYTDGGVGRGVDVSAYQEIVFKEPVFRKKTPHDRFPPILFCTRTCLEKIAEMTRSLFQEEKIAVILEQGRGVGETIDYCLRLQKQFRWALRYCSFTIGNKFALPLQAADLLAYETRIYIKEQLSHTGLPLRESLQRLLKNKTVSINVGTRERFITFLDSLHNKERSDE